MKTVLVALIGLLSATVGWADETPSIPAAPTFAESNCGSNWVFSSQAYASDDGRSEFFYMRNASIRSITVRSTKRKTVIDLVRAYDNNSGRWLNFTPRFKRIAQCEVRGGLCEDQEATICIDRSRDLTQLEVFTTGSNSGSYRVKLGYRNY